MGSLQVFKECMRVFDRVFFFETGVYRVFERKVSSDLFIGFCKGVQMNLCILFFLVGGASFFCICHISGF